MSAYAWSYTSSNGKKYWTYSYVMSATQFADKVGEMTNERITASDVSQILRRKDINFKKWIYIDEDS